MVSLGEFLGELFLFNTWENQQFLNYSSTNSHE
jgi:hypothetical protein